MKQSDIAVITINWNGEEDSLRCIEALQKQTLKHTIIAVDNGSVDTFSQTVTEKYPEVILLKNEKNLGFAGGSNTGIRYAVTKKFKYIALINNDAVPHREWLSALVRTAETDKKIGVVASKMIQPNGKIDSVGESFSKWGMAFPFGRDEEDTGQYEVSRDVFAASGGASLYKTQVFNGVGLFDEDFFAYYEDVDLCFRARLSGWRVIYEPTARVTHKIGASSSKRSGFVTNQALKNLPWVIVKNVPVSLLPPITIRFLLLYKSIIISALFRGEFLPVTRGIFMTWLKLPIKIIERRAIRKKTILSSKQVASLLYNDLPPGAKKLKRIFKPFL